jgi:uncharacterized protein (TIGR03032 family)
MPPIDSQAEAALPVPLPPLRSVHTTTFGEILTQFGFSLLVTTYQAGKLVVLRADQGVINTHFRSFLKPMGLALQGGRLAIGTAREIQEFHNVRALAPRLEPAGKHDACFLPRSSHTTGEIFIHEMGFVTAPPGETTEESGPELCLVNTRFSCLCTLDRENSFVPRWQPPFITALAPEDRCHLNGIGLVDGRVRYVTALGETDTAGGWRANKRNGGLLMEVPSGEILVRGLSMPHSPRWHKGKLWLLESGTGTIGTVDLPAGRYEAVAEVPGFSRGLDFFGDLAFIGLSQVRETAVFSGLPLTERLNERTCGVWVVDVAAGRTVAFLKFEDAVQEIFAVQVLPNVRFPDLINDDPKILNDYFVLPDISGVQYPGAITRMAPDRQNDSTRR